jgi:glycosyltransferase involved in cell wall biosynthesis
MHALVDKDVATAPQVSGEAASQSNKKTFTQDQNVLNEMSQEARKEQAVTQEQTVTPLRICLLGYRSHPYSGGQGIYLKYLSAALCDLGHRVDVISGAPYPILDSRVKLIKLPSLGLFEKKSKFWGVTATELLSPTNFYEWLDANSGGFPEPYTFGRRLVSYMKKHSKNYDIVHDNQSLCYGLLDLQKMGIPTIATIHHPITKDKEIDLNETDDWGLKLLIRRWYSFLGMQSNVVKKLNNIITVSECSRQDIAADFGISADHLDLVYNGIDTEAFSPMPDIKRLTNRIMATASADAPLKGLNYLLKAFASLEGKYPDLELLVIGKPKPGGHTERLIDELKIKDKLIFMSGISEQKIRELYAEATLAVVPSLYEGFGLPAGEAMSCGVPLISTNGGSLPEVVGDAGIIVEKGNAQAIATAIESLLNDSQLRDELSIKGRQRIVEKFCWQQAAKQMTHYYTQVIAQK